MASQRKRFQALGESLALGVAGVLALGLIACGQDDAQREALITKIDPSVVRVSLGDSLGSGFVVDATRGIIATNYHVIAHAKDAKQVSVRFGGDRQKRDFPCDGYVAILPGKDLALIHVQPTGDWKLQSLRIANSLPSAGATVYTFGCPIGMEFTVSAGMVSAVAPGARGQRTDRQVRRRRLLHEANALRHRRHVDSDHRADLAGQQRRPVDEHPRRGLGAEHVEMGRQPRREPELLHLRPPSAAIRRPGRLDRSIVEEPARAAAAIIRQGDPARASQRGRHSIGRCTSSPTSGPRPTRSSRKSRPSIRATPARAQSLETRSWPASIGSSPPPISISPAK